MIASGGAACFATMPARVVFHIAPPRGHLRDALARPARCCEECEPLAGVPYRQSLPFLDSEPTTSMPGYAHTDRRGGPVHLVAVRRCRRGRTRCPDSRRDGRYHMSGPHCQHLTSHLTLVAQQGFGRPLRRSVSAMPAEVWSTSCGSPICRLALRDYLRRRAVLPNSKSGP